MELSLYTPARKIVENEVVDELLVPGAKGELDIFDLHADFVTELETGYMRWKSAGQWKGCTVSTGFLEIHGDKIIVLSETSELPEEIDERRAKNAEVNAKAKLEGGGLDDENFRKYELKLKRALLRQMASK